MKLLPIQRYGAYLRKMAIDGYVIYTDTGNIKEFTSELQGIGRNINQIAKRLNSGAPMLQSGNERVLPVISIYGANASGKSNIYQAFEYMTQYVIHSFKFGGDDAY